MSGFYWIASYPKSGNTWLRLALYALLNPNDPLASLEKIRFAPNASRRNDVEDALDIESGDLTAAELQALRPVAYRVLAQEARQPLYRKVHDAWTEIAPGVPLFPPEVTLGAIIVVRDPRDVAVSWAHFAGIGMDEAIAALCDPAAMLRGRTDRPTLNIPQRLLCWSGHVHSWLGARCRQGCLVRYEDMLADPAAVLRRVAGYIGAPHDEGEIDRAVAATRFEALRERERQHGFDGGQRSGRPFFRSGRAGGWREALTQTQAARIRETHSQTMRMLGYLEEPT